MVEQDERGAECLGVEKVRESYSGQVSAVPDKQRLARINELSLYLRNTVLFGEQNDEIARSRIREIQVTVRNTLR